MSLKFPVAFLLLFKICSASLTLTPLNGATASSAIPGDWALPLAASAVIDGNTTNFFTTNSGSQSQYLDVSFENIQNNIQLVRLYPRPGGMCFPGTISLQYDEFGTGVWKNILPWSFNYSTAPTSFVDIGFYEIPINAKKIRINATNLRNDEGGANYFQLAEVQVFRETQLNNQAPYRQVYPSSAISDASISGWPESHLIDNNTYSTYSSPASTLNQTRYCGVQFSSLMYGVSRIEFYPRPGGWGFPKSFKIQYQPSYAVWSDIPGNYYYNQSAPQDGTPFVIQLGRNPISAMGIRLVSLENGVDNYNAYFLQLSDIRVYVEEGLQWRYSNAVTSLVFSDNGNFTPSWDSFHHYDTTSWFWDLKNVDAFDNNAVFSTKPLNGSQYIGYSGETSPTALILNYPDQIYTNGIYITPRSGGLGFPRAFTVSTSTNRNNGFTTEATFSNFTSTGEFYVPFSAVKPVKAIKIQTSVNGTDGGGSYYLQLAGIRHNQALNGISLASRSKSSWGNYILDHLDGNNKYLYQLRGEIYDLPTQQFVQYLRVAFTGGTDPRSVTSSAISSIDYMEDNGSWISVPASELNFTNSGNLVKLIAVGQNIRSVRVSSGFACATSVGSPCTEVNTISEVTPMN